MRQFWNCNNVKDISFIEKYKSNGINKNKQNINKDDKSTIILYENDHLLIEATLD